MSAALRVRAALDRRFTTVLVVAVAFVVIGGWLAAGAYLFPGSHPVQRSVSSWDAGGNFSHQATVEGNGTAFEQGTVVSNREVYFESVMPVLDTTYAFSYDATESGSLDAVIQSRLIVKGVSGGGEESVTYWTVTESLATNQFSDVEPGETVATTVAVNVSAAMTRARDIADELGTPSALLRAEVQVMVQTQGTVNNRTVNKSLVYGLPLTFRGGIYRVEDPQFPEGRFVRTEQVQVSNPPGFLGGVVGPVLFLLGVGSTAGLVVARRRGRLSLSEREYEWLRYQLDRREFDDWISRVMLPADTGDREVIVASTLADLVDVAIDADEPVLEDHETGDYHVLHDGFRYTFERPVPPETIKQDRSVQNTAGRTDLEVIRNRSYQDLRQLAAREGLDVGASPSKADLVTAIANADITIEDGGTTASEDD